MRTYVALLRAVNVGRAGKLPMADLRRICEEAGFGEVRTYIQSGNVVLTAPGDEGSVRESLEGALAAALGRRVGVIVRQPAELESVLADNPFPEADPRKVIVMFHATEPPPDVLEGVRTLAGEEFVLRGREIYVHYPDGQGASRLRVPLADRSTGRNLNTVARLTEMAA